MPSRQGRILSRSYALATAAGVVPLLVLVLALATFQFTTQRHQLLEELRKDASSHNVLLSGVLKSARDYVLSLNTWAELHLVDDPVLAGPTGGGAWAAPDARLLLRDGRPPERPGAQSELALAAGLLPHMRLGHRTMPYLRWSYYFAGAGDFVTIFPLPPEYPLGGRLGAGSAAQVLDVLFAQDLVKRGLDAAAGVDLAYWTTPYLDPGGAGWVVGHALPVRRGEQVAGVVGTAVLVDFLTGFLRAFDYPAGRLWLVNEQQQVLAASDGRVVAGLDLVKLADALPEALRSAPPAQLLAPSPGFRRVNGQYVLAQTVGSAPWRLLFVISPSELTRVILPRFVPYGVILAGLILTVLLAQQLRQRLIIGPALALVEFVRAESQEQPAARPKLPAVWAPWLDAVAEAFEAKRNSLRQIQDSARHFRTLAQAHPVPVAIVSLEDGRILHASQSYAEQYRIPPEEVQGRAVSEHYVDPEDRRRFLEILRRDGSVRAEFLARRADGTVFPALLNSRIIEYQGRPAIITGVLDLSEQKRAEAEIARQREALRRSEQRFRTIAEAHPVPMCIVRRSDRRIVYANQRFAELMGLTPEQVQRAHSYDFYPDARDRERWNQALRRDRAFQDLETTARRADGTLFPVALTAQVIEYEGQEAGVFGMVDLTEKKRSAEELARQREALHQSEKLNALGSMLANVAHELNNPLSVVVGYATMMRDLAPDEPTRERAARIHAAAERCARIVRTFLAMARRKPESRGPVQLNQIVEAALEVAGYGLRTTDVSVSMDLAPDLPEVTGDADQLTLVVMNLIVNAQHALQEIEPPRRLAIRTAWAAGELRLEVQDNGPGIPPGIGARIFEPFFTTKPQGLGTGIGLSVCRNVVAAHGGEVWHDAPVTGGARFTVVLPLSDVPLQADRDPVEAAAVLDAPSGRILIVEDEVEIADMLAEILSRDGHEVLLAASGREALERLATEPVDLIISDLHMPDLGGPELYKALAERCPDLAARMLFMTGDVLGADVTGFLTAAEVPVLDKPIDPYDIRLKVRAQLAARRRSD